MKKLYQKSELAFALACIAVYCILQSLANPLNKLLGIEYAASAILCLLQAGVLLGFLRRQGLLARYGLCKSPVPARRFLFYLPLILLATRNLWNGAAVNLSPAGTACYIACMLGVGFVEEVIFRGLLFRAMERDNVKTAILVSSVTFGLGHLLNLVNGSGAALGETLFQVTGAIAIGFLFVLIFHRGKSLLPCIVTHAAINITSAFANETGLTTERRLLFHLLLFLIIAAYAALLAKTLPKPESSAV